jgi:hypothetical protein
VNYLTFNNAELRILRIDVPTCVTNETIFRDRSFNEKRRRTRCSRLGLKMSPTPQNFLACQVSGV